MKASDITDEQLVEAVRKCARATAKKWGRPYVERATKPYGDSSWAMLPDVEAEFPDFPWKVVLAKVRKCMKKGLIGGCDCGCRGDLHVLVQQ